MDREDPLITIVSTVIAIVLLAVVYACTYTECTEGFFYDYDKFACVPGYRK